MGAASGGGTPPSTLALRVEAYSWQSAIARNRLVALGDRPIIIGSDPGCDVAIYDAAVAPRHAAVVPLASGGYAIEDLGSATGTWAQGVRIAQPARLVAGQTIHIGEAELVVTALAPAALQGQVAQPLQVTAPPAAAQPPRGAGATHPAQTIPALPPHRAPPGHRPAPPSDHLMLPESGEVEMVPYCPLCALTYPPGATICAVCGSRLTEALVN